MSTSFISFRPTLVAAVMLLGACATGPGDRETDRQRSTQPLALLNDITTTLPGRYSNHAQWREQDQPGPGPFELLIVNEPVSGSDRSRFNIRQTDARGQTRGFRLELAPGSLPDHLDGMLYPLDTEGNPRGQCQMTFVASARGFSGETRPDDCRFGDGVDAVGLLKELAFDGRQVIIADRLTRLATGEPAAEDQVLRFFQSRTFSGWAGSRQGEEWQLSGELELHSEGSEVVPRDADGASLGLRLQLARVNWRDDQPPILRLSVYDEENGDLIGYAWADEDASQVGINLPEVQVGLREQDL